MSSPIISFDGIKIQVNPADLDGDGIVGGVETLSQNIDQDKGIQTVTQPTELGETIKELNEDTVTNEMGMSGIDLRARLHYLEISNLLALDTLVALNFLPREVLPLSRQKKRLSVSDGGKGRDDIVNIVAGKREQEAGSTGGFFNKATSWFKPKPSEPKQ